MSLGSIVVSQNQVVNKPKGGSFNLTLGIGGFIRLDKTSYVHIIKGNGGFYSAKLDIYGPEHMLDELFENGLARDVKTYNHSGTQGWEGLITTMRQTNRYTERLVTLDNTINKVKLKATENRRRIVLTSLQNTDSQDNYGILEELEEFNDPTVSSDRAESVQVLLLNDLSEPQRKKELRSTFSQNIKEGQSKLSIFCSGYGWYLARRLYSGQTRSSVNASTFVSTIISSVGQFVQTSSIETNTQQVYQQRDNDDPAWDILMDLGNSGDTSDDRYILGMYENRRFVYEKRTAPTLINITLIQDRRGLIKTRSARPLSGMLARPNTFLRNTGIGNQPGKVYTSVWDDPQVTYIGSVVYSEKTQSAKFATEVEVPRQSPMIEIGGVPADATTGSPKVGGRHKRKSGGGKWQWGRMTDEERAWWLERKRSG